jgi:endogenous inhibitor of DNA gyrase (YacG/DUF329 family)
MKKIYEDFLESIKAQLSTNFATYERFMLEETYLNGNKFSFLGHDYQQYCTKLVEDNPGFYFYIMKCSQIGLSEWANRMVLSRMGIRAGTSAVISFPTKTFAQEVMKTRLTSVIDESPRLRSLLSTSVDSASVKAFVNNSIIYALGGNMTQSGRSLTLLNRPVDTLLVDEYDKQDLKIISGYRSRMKHTPAVERLLLNISTPTVAGIGISAEIDECRTVHTPWILHKTCGHEFIGDFFADVFVPGFNQPIRQLSKTAASKLDLSLTYLKCPGCGKPILDSDRGVVWHVTTNDEGVAKKIGVVLDPFVASSFISMTDLVESFLEYTSTVEFLNQELGKTADKADSTIDVSKVVVCKSTTPGQYIFGLDLGKNCHYMRGVLHNDSTVHVEHKEIIKLSDLELFIEEQHKQFSFTCGVMDSMPYTDLVYRMVKKYPRLFSAIYSSPNPPRPELYRLTQSDKYDEFVRQVNINKPLAMDSFAGCLSDFYTFDNCPLHEIMLKHFGDMRRVRDYRFEEMIYTWVKSRKGDDHFWHTAIYTYIAGKLAYANVAEAGAVDVVLHVINPTKRREQNAKAY